MGMGTQQLRQLCKWKLFRPENGLYPVQSGVFPTKFGHKLLLMIIMTRQCVANNNHVARLKVRVTVHT